MNVLQLIVVVQFEMGKLLKGLVRRRCCGSVASCGVFIHFGVCIINTYFYILVCVVIQYCLRLIIEGGVIFVSCNYAQ